MASLNVDHHESWNACSTPEPLGEMGPPKVKAGGELPEGKGAAARGQEERGRELQTPGLHLPHSNRVPLEVKKPQNLPKLSF